MILSLVHDYYWLCFLVCWSNYFNVPISVLLLSYTIFLIYCYACIYIYVCGLWFCLYYNILCCLYICVNLLYTFYTYDTADLQYLLYIILLAYFIRIWLYKILDLGILRQNCEVNNITLRLCLYSTNKLIMIV